MESDNNNNKQYHHEYVSESAHLCAAIARFSGQLNGIDEIGQIANFTFHFLAQQNLHGFLRIKADEDKFRYFVNNGCTKSALMKFDRESQNKVQQTENCLYFRTTSIDLILDTSVCEQSKKDVLMDGIAIFVDIVQTTLEQRFKVNKLRQEHHQRQNQMQEQMWNSIELIKGSNNALIGTFQNIVDNLVCELTAKLHTLALEPDQEEYLLNLIDEHCKTHHSHIVKHVESNEASASSILSTVEFLLSFADESETPECEEDFALATDDVVLF